MVHQGRIMNLANSKVDMSVQYSLICTNCYDFSIDIDVKSVFEIVNRNEMCTRYGGLFGGNIVPGNPLFDMMRVRCACGSHSFLTVHRMFKEVVMTLGKKNYTVYGEQVMYPSGDDWPVMYLDIDNLSQYAKRVAPLPETVMLCNSFEPTRRWVMPNFEWLAREYPMLVSRRNDVASSVTSYGAYHIFPLDRAEGNVYETIVDEFIVGLSKWVDKLPNNIKEDK